MVRLENKTNTFLELELNSGAMLILNVGQTSKYINENELSNEIETLIFQQKLVMTEKKPEVQPKESEDKEVVRKDKSKKEKD